MKDVAQIEHSMKIEQTLKQHFGFERFWAGQREIVEQVLAGRDAFVLMPTGAGKSLTYQLPALLMPGLTIVVSPLIALMQDQVDRLRANGIAATFINKCGLIVAGGGRGTLCERVGPRFPA